MKKTIASESGRFPINILKIFYLVTIDTEQVDGRRAKKYP